MAKTLPFHGSNMGSIPIRCIVGNDKGDSQPLKGVHPLEVALIGLSFVQRCNSISGFTVFCVLKALDEGLVSYQN